MYDQQKQPSYELIPRLTSEPKLPKKNKIPVHKEPLP